MRSYEFTAVFYADEEKAASGAQYVLKKFEEAQAQVEKDEDLGVRQLAYLIKKEDKGHYRYYEIRCDPTKIKGLTADFLLSGNMLKFLFVAK